MRMPIFRVVRIVEIASLLLAAQVMTVASAEQSKQAAVRTIASDAMSLVAPADMQVDPEHSFDLAASALLEDEVCVRDKPLWAGMSVEDGLECQRQFLDVDATY